MRGLFRLLLPCLLAGCAATLAPQPPAGFDLAGAWRLDAAHSDMPPQPTRHHARELREELHAQPGMRGGGAGEGEAVGASAGPGRLAIGDGPDGDLLLLAMASPHMRIEQDVHSMGIDYAPLRPGARHYRDIAWGTRDLASGRVEAGWDARGALVVRREAGREEVAETYALDATRQRLTVTFEYADRDGEHVVRRVFQREPTH